MTLNKQSLALGTASFSGAYGVTQEWGVPTSKELEKILAIAKNKVEFLDTAIAYGDCEKRLGEIGVKEFKIITKIPKIPKTEISIEKWLISQCQESLKRLKKEQLYGFLLHEPNQLLSPVLGKKISKGLQFLKNQNMVEKIGISIYSATKLKRLNRVLPLDIIQAPVNIFDRRFLKNRFTTFLKENKIEFHCRSIFLQGLLLLPRSKIPQKFKKWDNLFSAYQNFLRKTKNTALEVCVSFVRTQPGIKTIVFGVHNQKQLTQILEAYSSKKNFTLPNLDCSEIDLILPPRWKYL